MRISMRNSCPRRPRLASAAARRPLDCGHAWRLLRALGESADRIHGSRAMTQNIYDNPEFFEGYGKLPRSIEGLAGAAEWPALRALLPVPGGLRILDLGCGYGW